MVVGYPLQVLVVSNTSEGVKHVPRGTSPSRGYSRHSPSEHVSISGVSRMISTDLMMGEELAVGDWVLIHVGFALGKIDEAEATETLKQIKQLGGGTFEDELESFTSSQIE